MRKVLIAISLILGITASAGASCLKCLDTNVACASNGKYLKCHYGRPLLNLLHSCPTGQVCANISEVCAPIGTVEPACNVCSDDYMDERLCPRRKRESTNYRASQELMRDLTSSQCAVTGDEFCKQEKRVGVFKHPCKKFCRKYIECKKQDVFYGTIGECGFSQQFDEETLQCENLPPLTSCIGNLFL